jgi:hypothetical protein
MYIQSILLFSAVIGYYLKTWYINKINDDPLAESIMRFSPHAEQLYKDYIISEFYKEHLLNTQDISTNLFKEELLLDNELINILKKEIFKNKFIKDNIINNKYNRNIVVKNIINENNKLYDEIISELKFDK